MCFISILYRYDFFDYYFTFLVKFGKKGSDLLEKCKCLPACNYIQYDAEFLKTDYEVEDLEEDNARERYVSAPQF